MGDRFTIQVEFKGLTLAVDKPLWHADPLSAATLIRHEAELVARTLERLYETGMLPLE